MSKGVRFAPSPTGAFHIGNLRTALISHAWSRLLNEPWIVRFEDIDQPRIVPGAQERQLGDLKALGLTPDKVLVQSEFSERHWKVFERAVSEHLVYPCFCSRKDVREALERSASAPHRVSNAYSGRCRDLTEVPEHALPSLAWRFRFEGDSSGGQDFIIARTSPELDSLRRPRRESFVPAYNWACAIDDYDGDYSLIVRAWDLASVLDQQRAVQKMLLAWGEPGGVPAVFHCALVVGNNGERLEKRTQGVTLRELLDSGHSVDSIVRKLSSSFALDRSKFSRGAVFGEKLETISVGQIGI